MPQTESLNSLAHCCQILQRPFKTVQQVAEKLRIIPALTINGVAHFTDHQVETLRRHFAGEQTSSPKK